MIGIRGAITVDNNTKKDINECTKELIKMIIAENNIQQDDMVSILFSATKDLDSQYPAVAAREMGITETPLFCVQEMDVIGSLEKCIRVLVHCNTNLPKKNIKHIYLKEAIKLRPDIADVDK
ncbi:chorismate mutase [Natranaerovirga pectinivora]|uniref:chorismate mutase n=1 Tax=Natranaerovirga pectinivora TaxID=682400 RepID=A0A4R3MKM1_9FIRM|nr:chorismate mutase [Natranaerovirga pectinivora]TCT15003.1 chorismate mutase [Natranaerovirga pectinivora]